MPAVEHVSALQLARARGRLLTSHDIEAMSPEEWHSTLGEAASIQRGHPEQVMLDIQRKMGGGLYSHTLEHVGDLTHRIMEGGGRYGTEFVLPKIISAHRSLTHPYGFGREVSEQVESNLRGGYSKLSMGDVRDLGRSYAEAHRQVPVFNRPTWLARMAAVDLGNHDFASSAAMLSRLRNVASDPESWKYETSQKESVRWMREYES